MTRPIGSLGRSGGGLGTHLGLLAGLWCAPWRRLGLALLAQVAEKVAAETPKTVKKLARNRRLGEIVGKVTFQSKTKKCEKPVVLLGFCGILGLSWDALGVVVAVLGWPCSPKKPKESQQTCSER